MTKRVPPFTVVGPVLVLMPARVVMLGPSLLKFAGTGNSTSKSPRFGSIDGEHAIVNYVSDKRAVAVSESVACRC